MYASAFTLISTVTVQFLMLLLPLTKWTFYTYHETSTEGGNDSKLAVQILASGRGRVLGRARGKQSLPNDS